jgi:hypothetical protein
MPINYAPFVVGRPDETEAVEIGRVEQIAKDLLGELRRISDEIDRVHRWRAKSDDIQKLFFGWLADSYDIVTESTEGFEDTTVHRVRPDAQILLNLEGTRRILVEVERGGAVTNGHDLKDEAVRCSVCEAEATCWWSCPAFSRGIGLRSGS